MSKKMLIDATHTEEVRVAVVDQGRLDEFDYESAFRKPLKGNIYLAKVTRVEPSLQAAFVNFGGNRHGFLPFSEIHPDYFRIPIADREALIAEQEQELKAHDDEDDAPDEDDDALDGEIVEVEDDDDEVEELGGETPLDEDAKEDSKTKKTRAKRVPKDAEKNEDDDKDEKPKRGRGRPKKSDDKESDKKDDNQNDEDNIGNTIKEDDENEPNGNVKSDDEDGEDDNRGNQRGGRNNNRGGRGRNNNRGGRGRNNNNNNSNNRGRSAQHRSKRTEAFGDDMNDEQKFRFSLRRKYKIQEVIKRGQIMLVQVSKEERGNKGAAVGSYLSLPGRYCVLMPNSPRAGGVSRKISNYKDRAKMRDMMKDLEVPKGMSVILRTAGVTRTKAEVKRDLDYLLRLWNTIREKTLESSAPALVYEEADLIKRAVRDLYTRDVEEIHVSGNEGYKTAKDFMKMMIPSHVKKVIEYKDESVPLFNKFKVEGQIADIGETVVTLKSGGYLVINPTEALISVDVNSGKATKERHIEETALKTNLEAAEEVARQMRLRDLGGLLVIDFIDMEDRRNNGKVERRMRDSLSGDRARIQMGRISSFGLMEMSRQRMSASLTESQFETCSHCVGMGRVRTADAASIMVLRAIEAEGIKGRAAQLIVHVPNEVAVYILNNKRKNMADIENRYSFTVLIRVDDSLGASGYRVEVSKPLEKSSDTNEDNTPAPVQADSDKDEDSDDTRNKNSRRRGRRGGRGRNNNRNTSDNDQNDDNAKDTNIKSSPSDDDANEENKKPTRRAPKKEDSKDDHKEQPKDETPKEAAKQEDKPKRGRGRQPAAKAEPAQEKTEAKPEPKPVKKASKPSNDDAPKKPALRKAPEKKIEEPKEYEVVNEAPKKPKKGWWNRK